MPQLILGVHSGSHDAAAAVFEDYSLKPAVHLERLTRLEGDGSQHPDLLGLSGGVFAKVKLNRLLAEDVDLDELYIFPAMGDNGLPVGGELASLLQRDGLAR